MSEIRVTVTGPKDLLDALETVFRTCGVAAERVLVSSYEGVAISSPAVDATASPKVLARCISAYALAQPAPHRVTFVVPGEGRRVIQDYSLKAIEQVLSHTDQLCLE